MNVYFERTLMIRVPSDDFTWWADFKWSEGQQIWKYKSANSGFMRKFNCPYEFTEQELTMFLLKWS